MTDLQYERINYNVVETGKAIRAALRETFPGVRFSLRGSRGTGYGWFSLSWSDGPTSWEVDELTNRFRSSYFDGMDDSTHQIPATLYADTDGVLRERRYSCHGVNVTRDFSEPAIAWAEAYVTAHGGPQTFLPAYADMYTAVRHVLSGVNLCGVDVAALPVPVRGEWTGRHVASSYCLDTGGRQHGFTGYGDGRPKHRAE